MIRIGVVGTSIIADMMIQIFEDIEAVKVNAICGINPEEISELRQKYNIQNTYTDYDMFLKEDLDALYIAVPNVFHYEYAKKALLADKHVLVEKPITVTYDQYSELIKIAKENNLIIQDGLFTLYLPEIEILKSSLSKVGKLRRSVLILGKYSSRYNDFLEGKNPATFQKKYSNGSLMDLGIYAVGVAYSLFGYPLEIEGISSKLENGTDVSGTVLFKYQDFEVVILHSKVTTTLIKSEIQGEAGTIVIDNLSFMESIELIDHNKDVTSILCKTDKKYHQYEVADFISNINSNTESKKLKYEDSLNIIKLLEESRHKSSIYFKEDLDRTDLDL